MKSIKQFLAETTQLSQAIVETIKQAKNKRNISEEEHLEYVIKIIGLCVCDKCGLKENLTARTSKEGEICLVCSQCGSSDWQIATSCSMGG